MLPLFPSIALSAFIQIFPIVFGIQLSLAQLDRYEDAIEELFSPARKDLLEKIRGLECNGPFKDSEIPKQKKISIVLEQHELFLKSPGKKTQGERGNFCEADLNEVDLSGRNLSEGNLLRANLSSAQLHNTNLSEAFLYDANLSRATMLKTNLVKAGLRRANLSKAMLESANLSEAELDYANLSEANLTWANLSKANLNYADLSDASLSEANLSDASLLNANLSNASLNDANLSGANMMSVDLSKTTLRGANLQHANLTLATFPHIIEVTYQESYLGEVHPLKGANFKDADITGVDLTGVIFDLKPGGIPFIPSFAKTKNLEKLVYVNPPHSLVEIRNGLKNAGMREQERKLTYVIKNGEMTQTWERGGFWGKLEALFSWLLFDLTSDWGMTPGGPLRILGGLLFFMSFVYMFPFSRPPNKPKFFAVGPERELIPYFAAVNQKLHKEGSECKIGINHTFFFPKIRKKEKWVPILSFFSVPFAGAYFSLLSAFRIGWKDLNVGTWISRIQPRDYTLQATGWVKFVSGLQSLISVYLLALWAITYFGRPFE